MIRTIDIIYFIIIIITYYYIVILRYIIIITVKYLKVSSLILLADYKNTVLTKILLNNYSREWLAFIWTSET